MSTKDTTELGPRPRVPAPADAERVEEQKSKWLKRKSKKGEIVTKDNGTAGRLPNLAEFPIPKSWRERYVQLRTAELEQTLTQRWYSYSQHPPLCRNPREPNPNDCPLAFEPGKKGVEKYIHNEILLLVRDERDAASRASSTERTKVNLTCAYCGRVAGAAERSIAGLEQYGSIGWVPLKETCCSACADLFADRVAERRRKAQRDLVAVIDARIDQRLAASNVRASWEDRA